MPGNAPRPDLFRESSVEIMDLNLGPSAPRPQPQESQSRPHHMQPGGHVTHAETPSGSRRGGVEGCHGWDPGKHRLSRPTWLWRVASRVKHRSVRLNVSFSP